MLSTMEDNIKQARHLEAQLQEMSMLSKHKVRVCVL